MHPDPAAPVTTRLEPSAQRKARLGALHWLLAGQSLLVVLLSVNRLSALTHGYALPYEALRWVDLSNMLVWPFLSAGLSYGTLRWIEYDGATRARHGLLLLLSVYLLAAGYGAHEVTNYLHGRFCLPGVDQLDGSTSVGSAASQLCAIITYNDDEFSHLVFFAGFVGVNLALVLAQAAHPLRGMLVRRDTILIAVNAFLIAAGVFANLAFEDTGLDLPVVVLVALLAGALWWRARRSGESVPVVLYVLLAYGPSALAVAAAKLAGLSR